MRQEMTHFDEEGNARMVDVSDKDVTNVSACRRKLFRQSRNTGSRRGMC